MNSSLFVLVLSLLFALLSIDCCPSPTSPFYRESPPIPSSSALLFTRDDIESQQNVLHISKGSEFIFQLKSNPTTGYSWHFLSEFSLPSSAPLSYIACHYIRDNNKKGLMGAGGVEEISFKANNKGKIHIPLQYIRPWLPSNDATIVVTVIVD